MPKFEIHIRSAYSADTSYMVALERQTLTAAHWPESFYLGLFEEGAVHRVSFVAQQGGVLQGFLVAQIIGEECELENIVVAEASRRRGLGSQLIRALIKTGRDQNVNRIFLEVRESNAAARALYENCGFVGEGRRTAYYSDPAENAVLYTLAL